MNPETEQKYMMAAISQLADELAEAREVMAAQGLVIKQLVQRIDGGPIHRVEVGIIPHRGQIS